MTIQLYPDGVTIKRVQKGRSRWYEVEGDERVAGVKLRNVTTALNIINKPQLNAWMVKQAREGAPAKDYAAEGNDTHEKIHQYLSDKEAALQEASANDINIFRSVDSVIASSRATKIWSEALVYSSSLGFGGTADLIIAGEDENNQHGTVLTVIDFKTGGIYDEHALQVAAYSIAIEEMTGVHCYGRVVQLIDNGYTQRLVKNMDTAKAVFTAALLIDEWQREKDVWV